VEGWQQFLTIFGGFVKQTDTPYAVHGYFENGGEVAYVLRIMGPLRTGQLFAQGNWVLGEEPLGLTGATFHAASYKVRAATPGIWANGTKVVFRYRFRGMNGEPQVDIEVRPTQEPPEFLRNLSPHNLIETVAERSRLIRLEALTPAPQGGAVGPLVLSWEPVELNGAEETIPTSSEYRDAAKRLSEQREVSLLVAPDLHSMSDSGENRRQILATLVSHADELHDRQVLATPPPEMRAVDDISAWMRDLRRTISGGARSLSIYHPSIRVPDPLGGIAAPVRDISPLGHVAGVISRLDRERGSHHTPANATVYEAVDLSFLYSDEELGLLTLAGINPLRCCPGRGLQVWGGRTAADPSGDPSAVFLAHRRLIHRLIRAIRRVTEPLIFDSNGPGVWLALVRAITTVLLEAFRAGALKGERPDEAFQVRCDEITNPPEQRDSGRVVCEIEVAPATPMEFITFRIAASADGRLEVIES
jgi:hypothetical protein